MYYKYRFAKKNFSTINKVLWITFFIVLTLSIILAVINASNISDILLPSNIINIYYIQFFKTQKTFFGCFLLKMFFNMFLFFIIFICKKNPFTCFIPLLFISYYIYISFYSVVCMFILYGFFNIFLLGIVLIMSCLSTCVFFMILLSFDDIIDFYFIKFRFKLSTNILVFIAILFISFFEILFLNIIKNLVLISFV